MADMTCPSCRSLLNMDAVSGGVRLALCASCQKVISTSTPAARMERKSGLALASMAIGVMSLAAFIAMAIWDSVATESRAFLWFPCLIWAVLGLAAVPLGTRALDDIDQPHRQRSGRMMARFGMTAALVSVAGTTVFALWAPMRDFDLRPTRSGLNVTAGPSKVQVPVSIYGEMPSVRGNESYHLVLGSTSARWKWHHPSGDVDPETYYEDFHATFAEPDFDDSEWRDAVDTEGRGFGYGEQGDAAYGVSLRSPPFGQRYTAYFRTRFTTEVVLRSMAIELMCDDGVIAYIDGQEVARHNVPVGAQRYRLLASQAVSNDDESVLVTVLFDVDELPPGEHVLAISLHNAMPSSSDLGIRRVALYGYDEFMSTE